MPYPLSRRTPVEPSLPALPLARLFAQATSAAGAYLSTNVNVVNLYATVRDKDGHIVTNLNKGGFRIAGRRAAADHKLLLRAKRICR